MQQTETADALVDRLLEDGYLRPDYAGPSIANVPDTVADVFGATADRPLPDALVAPAVEATEAPVEHVVAVVIDGFGWNRYADLRGSMPALGDLEDPASVAALTSTYPSETAAAMITLYTGLQPIEHGQLGWFSWYPSIDRVALSLPFTTRDGRPLDEVYGLGPDDLFDRDVRPTLGERLVEAGVDGATVQPGAVADSPTSRRSGGTATRLGYEILGEGLEAVRRRLRDADGPSYHLVYYPDVDAAAHRFGTRSAAYREALEDGLGAVTGFIDDLDGDVAERTLMLVTADHGFHDTDEDSNVDLGRLDDAGTLDLDAHLRRGADGRRLYPAGSPRNVQLYARDGHVDPLRDELDAAVDARIYDRAAAREAALFGDREPGPTFLARAPDLVVVPREGGLWYDDGELDQIGMHGGLHPREMLVPLLALRAG